MSGDGFHSGKGVTGASDRIPTVGFCFSLSWWQAARDLVHLGFQSQLDSPALSPDRENVLIMAEVMSGASSLGGGGRGAGAPSLCFLGVIYKQTPVQTALLQPWPPTDGQIH